MDFQLAILIICAGGVAYIWYKRLLEYERLRSSHGVYICITIRSILMRGVASEPRGETAVRPRPSRGVGRLRPLDSDNGIAIL